MEEGTFVEWLKHDGDSVQPGDALFVLESDKANEPVEAIDPGVLRLTPESPRPGDKVKVGQVLAYLAGVGEANPFPQPPGSHTSQKCAVLGSDQSLQPPGPNTLLRSVATRGGEESRPGTISPRARRVARELGIDWSTLQGTGRHGRIRERDIRSAAATASPGKRIPHSNVRRVIAARLLAGVTQAAPVTLTTRADAGNLVNLRQQFRASAVDASAPSYTDLIVKLTAAALSEHPLLQAQWSEEGLLVPERIDIAVAVDTEAGLLAPVLRGVDGLTLRQVTAQARDLIAQARVGTLSADQLRGATFTVTNLGMFGVDEFTPILSLPQCAVLGIGRIVLQPAVVEERIVPREQMTLSLTFDHRVVDGAPAARFLDSVRRKIENPTPWLIP